MCPPRGEEATPDRGWQSESDDRLERPRAAHAAVRPSSMTTYEYEHEKIPLASRSEFRPSGGSAGGRVNAGLQSVDFAVAGMVRASEDPHASRAGGDPAGIQQDSHPSPPQSVASCLLRMWESAERESTNRKITKNVKPLTPEPRTLDSPGIPARHGHPSALVACYSLRTPQLSEKPVGTPALPTA